MQDPQQEDRAAVDATLARMRVVVTTLAAGVLLLAGIGGFLDLTPLGVARRLSLPAGLVALVALVGAWRIYVALRERASEVADVATGCARYSSAVLAALALTEGIAFLGIVIFLLGGDLVSLTGVVVHVLLTGVLWPTVDKLRPFLGRAGGRTGA